MENGEVERKSVWGRVRQGRGKRGSNGETRRKKETRRAGTGTELDEGGVVKRTTHEYKTKLLVYRQTETRHRTRQERRDQTKKKPSGTDRLRPSQPPNSPVSSPSPPPRSSAQPNHEVKPLRSTLSNVYARANDATKTKNGNYESLTPSAERSLTSRVPSSPLRPSVRARGVVRRGKAVGKLVGWTQSFA